MKSLTPYCSVIVLYGFINNCLVGHITDDKRNMPAHAYNV